MQKNKYLLLASSFTTLLLLSVAASQEHFGKEWRYVQAQGRIDGVPIPVQLRQVVNPALGITDRCVSCHVSMAPGEEFVTGSPLLKPHPPVVHDPAQYGCTVCHGGQGLATEKADAHGDVDFWPQPMLPLAMSQAGCGTCHAQVAVPNAAALAAGQAVFQRGFCLACHRVEGRGGVLRGGTTRRAVIVGMDGPELSRVGATGFNPRWYEDHLAKSTGAASPETAKQWITLFGPIPEADRPALRAYLTTRMSAPDFIEAKSMFLSAGCLGCHMVSGVGGDEGPDLTREGDRDPGQVDLAGTPGSRSLAGWNLEHFRSPGAVGGGPQMPPLALTDDQLRRLTFYVLSLRRRDVPGSFMPTDRLRVTRFGEREFSPDGETIFGAFCTGCHGLDGMGRRLPGMETFPSVANPDLLSRVSDDFLATTIRLGRPGRRMPAWGLKAGGLRPDEIAAVVSFLRARSGVTAPSNPKPKLWVKGDVREGERLFGATCSGCHGTKGQGAEGPALNNRVLLESATDTYLVETIGNGRRDTGMSGFLAASPTRPALTPGDIESIVAFLRSWQLMMR